MASRQNDAPIRFDEGLVRSRSKFERSDQKLQLRKIANDQFYTDAMSHRNGYGRVLDDPEDQRDRADDLSQLCVRPCG